MKGLNKRSYQGSSLNTLAQLGTTFTQEGLNKDVALIKGTGSELGNELVMRNRAKRKLIAKVMALNLVDIAKSKDDVEMEKSIWNTFHCQDRLNMHDGKLFGNYCKNRFCPLCLSIRKARIINNYYSSLRQWTNPHFLTLTVKSPMKDDLSMVMRKAKEFLIRIIEKHKKREQRGKGKRLVGIYSLECNFNPVTKTYNPHFHLILAEGSMGDILKKEWREAWRKDEKDGGGYWARPASQLCEPVYNLDTALIEVIKYGSKIFTEPDVSNKKSGIGPDKVYALAFYNILKAMKGLRLFEHFGFSIAKKDKKPEGARLITDFTEWIYSLKDHEWLSSHNELVLTSYVASEELLNLLRYGVDKGTD